jgi:uncharacterized protein YigA (DUF484 family)
MFDISFILKVIQFLRSHPEFLAAVKELVATVEDQIKATPVADPTK